MKKLLPKIFISSALIAIPLGALKYLSNHRGIVEFDRLCITTDSTVCGEAFGIRFINGKWIETYARGITVSAQMETMFDKPIYWTLWDNESGDDWSSQLEYRFLDYFITTESFKTLGKFRSKLEKRDDNWILNIDFLDRKEKLELKGRKFY